MEPKSGDRVSLDAKKVGQTRRAGVVRSVTHGVSGIRYEISWDDGSVSVIAPGAGVLLVEGRSSRSSASKGPKPKAKASKSKAPKAQKAKKSGSKAKTGKRK